MDDFKKQIAEGSLSDSEKQQLLDEMSDRLDRMARALEHEQNS